MNASYLTGITDQELNFFEISVRRERHGPCSSQRLDHLNAIIADVIAERRRRDDLKPKYPYISRPVRVSFSE